MGYFPPPLTTDTDALLDQVFEDLQARWPGWEPHEANLEVVLSAAVTALIAELRDVASDVPDEILRVIGARLHNTPAIEAAPATVDTTWTVVNDDGYTIPAGTEIGVAITGSESSVFVVTDDVTIAPGDTTGTVAVEAAEPGAAGNDLSGTVTLLNPLFDWVVSITVEGATSGGVDAEADTDYLARLVARLQLQAPRPILPRDFAVMARDIAGVGRATAIDGYNPADDTFDNERMVAVAVTDSDGETLASPVKAEVDAYLQAMREVNFVVNVIDPTYHIFDVEFAVTPLPGFDQTTVNAAVTAALTAYLSPGSWGEGIGGDAFTAADWINDDTVRYLELAQVANDALGVRHIDSLEFAEQGDPLATTDVAMDGAAPLPRPGTIGPA